MKDAILLVLVMSLFFGAMYAYAYMEERLDSKRKKSDKLFVRFFSYWWSRRESNSRPNKPSKSFLHVYSSVSFRLYADQRQSTHNLSS